MELKRQVLVVEDNLFNRELLTEILKDQYTVIQAENGQEALDILKRNKGSIDLILLDVMMPVMDGYTFLKTIKADDELALIPVIVTTESDSEEDEVSALEHGATDFVPKPYRPRVILNRIGSIIKLRETSSIVNQFQYDRLTGLYSKEYFYQKVREELLANPEKEYCIVCSNIENFKLYNDSFGVKAGDRILKEIAEVFRNIVGENGFCGRLRADRFLCFQEREKAYQNRQMFEHADADTVGRINKTVMRWGIYDITDKTIPVEQMCDRSVMAVESIKGEYNKHFAVYDDEMLSKMLREQKITDVMETALQEEQFEVYLQPKYSLKDKCMVGAETLVCWVHPEWGFMSPGEFIPLFEQNGFIPNLDRYVWERVCAQMKSWRDKGYRLPVISVNVSRSDIYQPNLVNILLKIVNKYEIQPENLHLEITESAYVENPENIIEIVEEFRKLGFIIEMDDFGSGYSSLSMLSSMHLDVLKLDMKFIQNEISKPEQQSILNDVISMAHRIRLSVVAEGIETREQMEKLQYMGCDYAQGYFFAKPMPIDEFEKLWLDQSVCHSNNSTNELHYEDSLSMLLVADEDISYREKIRQTFERQYIVVEASDKDSALKIITSYKKDRLSAVILSMTLPEDGAASVVKTMRQDPAFWDIPIIGTMPGGAKMEDFSVAVETDGFLCKKHSMIDLRRRLRGLVCFMEMRKRERLLQKEASHDYLTGLLNRRGFKAETDALRAEDFPLAVCLFDLDDLKKVNDNYGHETGDRMLQIFAENIRNHTRTTDIRCRYGGDEFAVILKQINDEQTALKKGSEICHDIRESVSEENISTFTSCGIALLNSYGESLDDAIERADKALYRAKRENKGSCCLWEEEK